MAKLYFRYSAMNAGKSTYLLQVAHNYNETGQGVRLLTASVDDRYGQGRITSRLGIEREAEVFSAQTCFSSILSPDVACVLVDEAQFLTLAQVKELHQWAHQHNIPVMCFGIRTDFKGEAFPGAAALLALAEDLEEIKTICGCGKKATMNVRLTADGQRVTDGDQVLIGGNNRYRQVCAKCFYSPRQT